MIYRARLPIGEPGKDPRFEELLRRYDGWVQVFWRVLTMGKEDGLKGSHSIGPRHRTWAQEWAFLEEAWEVFQSLPEKK